MEYRSEDRYTGYRCMCFMQANTAFGGMRFSVPPYPGCIRAKNDKLRSFLVRPLDFKGETRVSYCRYRDRHALD